jgi:soluble lytic murein transglycosylase
VAPNTRARAAARPAPKKARRRTKPRRWPIWLAALALIGAGGYAILHPYAKHAVKELALPLRHEDVIRQQAKEKGLDPSLIAAVIYVETRYVPRVSSAGAVGLMQITPETAQFIAHRSGGTAFQQSDLATPQINIAYGAYYLRYLLRAFDANVTMGLAAYNGGEGNVRKWVAQASAEGHAFTTDDIPFGETRHYVRNVLDAQKRYRARYSRELGMSTTP